LNKKYDIACGSYAAMVMIKERGFKGLNPRTNKFQIIDKNAKYEIVEDGIGCTLKSDKDLRKIAKEKGLII